MVQFSVEARDFFPSQGIQTDTGAQPATFPVIQHHIETAIFSNTIVRSLQYTTCTLTAKPTLYVT